VPNSDVFEIDPMREPSEIRTGFRWDWLLAFTAAWILFDIFTEPALAVAIASFKFGWNDFVNGLWLRQRDPDRRRGNTHFVFYSAAAFWRITVTTFLIVIAGLAIAGLIAVFRNRGAQNNAAGWHLTGMTMFIVCISFVLSSLTSWVAMLLAWRRRHKVWVHPDVRVDRRRSEWPPRPFGNNQLSRVITSSMIFLVVAIVTATSIAIVSMVADRGRVVAPPAWLPLALLGGMFASALIVLVVRDRAIRTMSASSPLEAWPESAFEGEKTVD
jgi:amino acid transporter